MYLSQTEILTLITQVGTVVTILSFLSGFQICFKIWSKGSTSEFSIIPFLFGTLSTSLWFRYGLYLNDDVIIRLNIFGVTLFSFYTLFFYLFTSKKQTVNTKILMLILTLILLIIINQNVDHPIEFAGLAASTSGVVFCASPLAAILDVFESKTVDKLPFLLIFSSFLVSTLWFLYGLLKEDYFIQIPNGLGSLISGLQLSLFAIYPSRKYVQI